MATNTNPFYTYSATAGSSKTLQKPQDGGDNNQWGNYINTDLDEIVSAVNALSDKIADASQNTLVDFTATGSAVNHLGITNAAAGNGPTIEAKGDDTNIDLNVSGKGTGKLATTSPKISTSINDADNNELIKINNRGSAVNEITIANAATGNPPEITATGDNTNIDLKIEAKGTGTVNFHSNVTIPNAGTIGSTGDEDAIAIASDGGVTFSGGIDNAGTIAAGTYNGTIGTSATGFGLITHADQWRYTTSFTGTGDLNTTSNFQQVTSSDSSSGGIGSGMTQASGVFTFPTEGIWLVICKATFQSTSGGILYAGLQIYVTTDNSSYTERARGYSNLDSTSYYQTMINMYMFDCQDTTTHKVRFRTDTSSSSVNMRGNTTLNYSSFTFLRLGDT